MSVNFDSKFDPPDELEIDIDEADPTKDICDYCKKGALYSVKRAYTMVWSQPNYLCQDHYDEYADDWSELFKS